jgi:hypothetical protein
MSGPNRYIILSFLESGAREAETAHEIESLTAPCDFATLLDISVLVLRADLPETVISNATQRLASRLQEYSIEQLFARYSQAKRHPNYCAKQKGRLLGDMSLPTDVLGLFTFNRSGYIREEALIELIQSSGSRALSYLLIASSDRVSVIRSLAETAVRERLKSTDINCLIDQLPLLFRLENAARGGVSPVFGEITAELAKVEHEEKLFAYLETAAKSGGTVAFSILLNHTSEVRRNQAIRRVLTANHFTLRKQAAEAAFWFFDREELEEVVPTMLSDSYAPIRLEAMRWAVKNDLRRWPTVVSNAIADRNSAVRLYARFVMRELDHRELYLQRLLQGRDIIASLRGLVEIKADVDPSVIEPFVDHTNAQVRAAAYGLLFRIDPFNCFKLIKQALSDKSNRCTREANKFLREHAETVPADTFIELLREPWQCENTASFKHAVLVVRTLLTAVVRLPQWTSLSVILSAKNGPPQIQERVDRALTTWLLMQQSGGMCEGDRAVELREKLELLESRGAIDAEMARELHLALK